MSQRGQLPVRWIVALQRVALLLPHRHRRCTLVARKSFSWTSVICDHGRRGSTSLQPAIGVNIYLNV
jgi:hypothetical protein